MARLFVYKYDTLKTECKDVCEVSEIILINTADVHKIFFNRDTSLLLLFKN